MDEKDFAAACLLLPFSVWGIAVIVYAMDHVAVAKKIAILGTLLMICTICLFAKLAKKMDNT